MANETASLVIVVDSTGVAHATVRLDEMALSGANAEKSTVALGASATEAGATIEAASVKVAASNAGMEQWAASMAKTAADATAELATIAADRAAAEASSAEVRDYYRKSDEEKTAQWAAFLEKHNLGVSASSVKAADEQVAAVAKFAESTTVAAADIKVAEQSIRADFIETSAVIGMSSEQALANASTATHTLGEAVGQAAVGIKGATAASIEQVAVLANEQAAVAQTGLTWRQFTAGRMSDYMKLEGGHAGAMKRMSVEWAEYKASGESALNGISASAIRTNAELEAASAESTAVITQNTVNAFGETAAMVDARHKAVVASYIAQSEASGQIVLSERAIAEAQGKRVEATLAEIEATRASVAAQDAQMTSTAEFIGVEQASTAAINENTIAQRVNTVSSRTSYEAGVLLSEAASGNFSRMKRSIAALGNSTGLLAKLFTPMGIAITGVTAVVGLLGVEAYKAGEAETELAQAIIRSGNAAGLDAEHIHALAAQYATYYTSAKQVVAIQEQLMASGGVTVNTFKQATQAAVIFGEATGESQKQVIQVFDQLAQNPLKTLDKINELYGNITPKIRDHVQALIDEGDKLGAVASAYQAIIDTMGKTAEMEHAQEGLIDRLVARWKNGAAEIGSAYAKLVNGMSMTEQFTQARSTYEMHLQSTQRNSPLDRLGGQVYTDKQLQDERAQVQALADKIQATRDAAGLAGQQTEDNKTGGAANAYYDAHFSKLDKIKEKQKEINDLTATYEQMWEHTGSDNARLAGVQRIVNADGTASFSGGSYASDLAGINDKFKGHTSGSGSRGSSGSGAAFSTFQNQVSALDVKSIAADDSSLTAYEQGIAKLADQMDVYMKKGGDATKAAELFNQGQQDLQKTLDLNRAKQGEAEQAFKDAYTQKSVVLQRSIDDQVNAISMGAKEVQRTQEITKAKRDEADAIANLALEYEKGKLGLSGGITKEEYDKNVKVVQDATNANVAAMQGGFKRIDAAQGSWLSGAKTAMKDYADAGQNVASMTSGAFTNAFTGMGDALTTFVTTGKLNFKSFVSSVLTDLTRIIVKYEESQALQAILGMFSGVSYGGGSGAASGTGAYSGFGSSGTSTVTYNATGGVYNSPGLSAYSGQVVSSPTMFAFANGAGLMGEAGPEAIMPLTRTSDGKLGVQSAGGGGGGAPAINVTIQTVIQPNGTQQTQSKSSGATDQLAKQLGDEVKSVVNQQLIRQSQPNGIIWNLMRGQNA
jgi:lambda family phage tail tape measure protein